MAIAMAFDLTKLGAGNIAQAAVIYDRGQRCGHIEV